MAWVSIQADVDVDLLDYVDRLSDDELCEEMRRRGYAVLKPGVPVKSTEKDIRTRIVDAQATLLRRQPQRAMTELQNIIANFVPLELLDAYDALRDDRVNDAIVRLDDAIEPRACSDEKRALQMMKEAAA